MALIRPFPGVHGHIDSPHLFNAVNFMRLHQLVRERGREKSRERERWREREGEGHMAGTDGPREAVRSTNVNAVRVSHFLILLAGCAGLSHSCQMRRRMFGGAFRQMLAIF